MIEKPTKIQVAIDNVKGRLAKADQDIVLLQRERETLFDVMMALEKINVNASFE